MATEKATERETERERERERGTVMLPLATARPLPSTRVMMTTTTKKTTTQARGYGLCPQVTPFYLFFHKI